MIEAQDRSDQVDIELLDEALRELEQLSPELARIVELRFFVGLTVPEIAEVLACSEPTVKRRWKAARLWLADVMGVG